MTGNTYSRSKREGERAIADSGVLLVILRLGFVIATATYGGSACAAPGIGGPSVCAAGAGKQCAVCRHGHIRSLRHGGPSHAAWRDGKRQWHET